MLWQSFLNLLQFSRFVFKMGAGQICSLMALAEVLPWTCAMLRELNREVAEVKKICPKNKNRGIHVVSR